jgi:hypothetical protein
VKIELRKVKVHKDMSEETTCYSAEVWLDGVKAGNVSNDGHGGCDRVQPRELHERLDAYAKTLPAGRYPNSVETVTTGALDEYLARRDFERRVKACVLLVGKDGKLRLTKRFAADALRNAVAHFVGQGERVLNALPTEEAFALYMAATAPKEPSFTAPFKLLQGGRA